MHSLRFQYRRHCHFDWNWPKRSHSWTI